MLVAIYLRTWIENWRVNQTANATESSNIFQLLRDNECVDLLHKLHAVTGQGVLTTNG